VRAFRECDERKGEVEERKKARKKTEEWEEHTFARYGFNLARVIKVADRSQS
jgi:hypothetical protein